MRARLSFGLVFALSGCGGDGDSAESGAPGTSGVNTGVECAESDLIAQCPPGSSPDLSAEATSECEGRVDFLLSGDGGAIEAACRGNGECLVVCQFDSPCQCGVDRITTEGVFCVDCRTAAACGDSKCDGGEDAATCPVDCAMVCAQGQQRCNGKDREDCNGQGSWERVSCRDDQACELSGGGVACQPFLSPSGGTWPGTGWSEVGLPHDPADIYFAEAEISCPPQSGACVPLAWLDDARLLGTVGGGVAILSTDGAPPEMLPVQGLPDELGVDAPFVVTRTRQPSIFNAETRAVRTAEPVVDDVTPLVGGSVAVDAHRGRAAVSFAASGQPFVALYALDGATISAMLRYAAPGYALPAASLAFSPNGELLAELRPEGRVIVWNIAERKHVRLIDLEIDPQGFNTPGMQVAFTAGLGPLLVMTTSGWVEIWDLDANTRLRRSQPRSVDGFQAGFALSPDGRIAASQAAEIGGLGLYSVATLSLIRTLGAAERGREVPPIARGGVFSADGRRLAAGFFVFTSRPFAE